MKKTLSVKGVSKKSPKKLARSKSVVSSSKKSTPKKHMISRSKTVSVRTPSKSVQKPAARKASPKKLIVLGKKRQLSASVSKRLQKDIKKTNKKSAKKAPSKSPARKPEASPKKRGISSSVTPQKSKKRDVKKSRK